MILCTATLLRNCAKLRKFTKNDENWIFFRKVKMLRTIFSEFFKMVDNGQWTLNREVVVKCFLIQQFCTRPFTLKEREDISVFIENLRDENTKPTLL